MKDLVLQTALYLKELGSQKEPITFDGLIKGVIGLDDLEFDNIDEKEYQLIENEVLLYLDSIGVPEKAINNFLSKDDKISALEGAVIAKSIDSLFDDIDVVQSVENFYDNIEDTKEAIEFDNVMPERKAGYIRKLVIRDGKKVWINKRNPNKKVILTPKQKLALLKARLKAHTGQANLKRKMSMKKRATFNLK